MLLKLLMFLLVLPSFADPKHLTKELDTTRMIKSRKLGAALRCSPGVPSHLQTEYSILNYMDDHKGLFPGKKVLDIGTGNGVIALYAGKLGAKEILATDINPQALEDVAFNSRNLKFDKLIKTQIVDPDKPGAFAAVKEGETFDLIISNPPYTVDLNETKDGNFTDASLLGASIVMGLDTRLAPAGKAVLLYRSFFYHSYLVKLAESKGFKVVSYPTDRITTRELEILFNSYAQKVKSKLGDKLAVLPFDSSKEDWGKLKINVDLSHLSAREKKYAGIMVISRK